MNKHHYEYIDAIRGYAILLVIAVHVSLQSTGITDIEKSFLYQGARGVQLFFIASALTLLLSWNSRKDGIAAFYLRRLFRVAPMFWIGIICFVWLYGFGPRYFAPNGINGLDIFLTSIFQHGWHPETINSVVPGGWSIAVEMSFYAIFPILAMTVKSKRIAVIGFLFCLIFEKISRLIIIKYKTSIWPNISPELIDGFLSLWIINQMPVFMIGFILYYSITDSPSKQKKSTLNFILYFSILLMIALALKPSLLRIDICSAYGISFGFFIYALSQGTGQFFVSRPLQYLGKISFSAYLWHFAILWTTNKTISGKSIESMISDDKDFIFFIQLFTYTTVATIFFSTITYNLIEKPFVKFGNSLIARKIKKHKNQYTLQQ